jgi:hypothetical protein
MYCFISVEKEMNVMMKALVIASSFLVDFNYMDIVQSSPRFLCLLMTLYIIARAVGRQSAIYTENS